MEYSRLQQSSLGKLMVAWHGLDKRLVRKCFCLSCPYLRRRAHRNRWSVRRKMLLASIARRLVQSPCLSFTMSCLLLQRLTKQVGVQIGTRRTIYQVYYKKQSGRFSQPEQKGIDRCELVSACNPKYCQPRMPHANSIGMPHIWYHAQRHSSG